MIARGLLEDAFATAVEQHHAALPAEIAQALDASGYAGRPRFGLALGKVAQAMARALGAVERGIVVTPFDDGAPLPAGWTRLVSSHPTVDERALVAGDAAIELVEGAPAEAVVVALISGGASALVEAPLVPLPELVRITGSLARLGAPIAELNAVRIALSAIKGGKLSARAIAPVVTLAVSDVIGDDLATIGSGPTIAGDPARQRAAALRVLARHELTVPAILTAPVEAVVLAQAYARVVIPMGRFARRFHAALRSAGVTISLRADPITTEVERGLLFRSPPAVMWGEPVVVVPPEHGEGGRMQHLALSAVRAFAGLDRCLFAIGTDGQDGPPPAQRPTPAGAYIDGKTSDAMTRANVDLQRALVTRDAGNALAAVGALVVTGPTGINHADIVVVH